MPLPSHPGIFTAVERQCADSEPTPPLRLFDGSDRGGVPLSLVRARQLLYDRTVCSATRMDLWRQVAERARFVGDGSDWPTAVVWLGLPGLRKTAFNIASRCRAERSDVEAELVTCYLEELTKVEAPHPDPGGAVLRAACSRTWSVWRKARLEIAVDDVESAGGPRDEPGARGYWQADYEPITSRTGLSAPVRITVPAHRVEGVRLGALAQAWGAADATAGVGYSGRGRQVAKISLRRMGRST
ncbi:hypothetical protein ACOBQB_07410 [Streptomyces sp. G5(2025)]|uniref:hypothetical protein n=1 Tax=Streptomyces sp. G5(2025) TaxID=3406628 RepID=UPI003C159331